MTTVQTPASAEDRAEAAERNADADATEPKARTAAPDPDTDTTYAISLVCRSRQQSAQTLEDLAILFYERYDGVLAQRDGIYTVTLFVTDSSGLSAGQQAVQDVDAVGLKVDGIDLDLVDTSEVAARLGLTRQAVNHWADGRRAKDFPTPLGSPGGRRIWAWGQLVPWLRIRDLLVEDEPLPLSTDESAELQKWIRDRPKRAGYKSFGQPMARTGSLGVKNVPVSARGWDPYERTPSQLVTAK